MTSKARILVVDDDRLVLATVTHGLSQAGFEVIDADNGDDAILLARQHRPDLALLDIRMEGLTGFDVAEALRVYGIPFMFLSAFSDPATLAKVQALGALDYLVKPLDVGQIVPSVESALERARSVESGTQAGPVVQTPSTPTPPSTPLPNAPNDGHMPPMADPMTLAMGVLMHRHSLTRDQARERLARMAQAQGHSPAEQADRLLAAVEELARSAL
jgi:response regulator NasT